MLYLDEDDDEEKIDIDRLVVEREPPPARFRVNLRPILVGLVVLVLGGGLGTGAYFFSTIDMGDVIGVLDVADQGPKLSMQMPGRGDGPAPAEPTAATPPAPGGPLLTPPGSPDAPAAATPAPTPTEQPAASATAAAPSSPAKHEIIAVPAQPSPPRDAGKTIPAYDTLPATAAQATPLPAAPISLLYRETPEGPLPIVALDGRLPWQEYRHPFTAPANRPMLGVVVTGLGLERDATEAAIAKLPPEVTLAFSPYASGLDKWIKKARDAGHEVMLAVPAEPSGFPVRDPGPWGLLTSLPAEDNVARLEKMMVRMPGYVGVLAEDGPFTRSATHLNPILQTLKERGLLYVGPGAVGDDLPAHVAVTEFADQEMFKDAIDARLFRAGLVAREQGRAMAVLTLTPVSLDRLTQWMGKNSGITIAPASALAQQARKS